MTDVARIARAIREAGLSGWLFYNQFHRDEISDLALDIPRATHNSRPWAYVVPAEGEPTRIVHAIEPGILDHLPGRLVRCTARDELFAAIGAALGPGARLAAQFSAAFPVSSFLDHGTARLIEGLGIRLVSSEELIVDCPRHARRRGDGLAPSCRPRAARRGALRLGPDPVGCRGG